MIRPRDALLRPDSLFLIRSGSESEIVRIGVSLGARFWSLSNSGRTPPHPGPNVETDQPLVCRSLVKRADDCSSGNPW